MLTMILYYGRELTRTLRSFGWAALDFLSLRTTLFGKKKKNGTFAFLVHPRTDEFEHEDVYGPNDIYRPYPAFAWLFSILPAAAAKRFVVWYAERIIPITLSRISVRLSDGTTRRGHLLSTVRTPSLLFKNGESTRRHMEDLFRLAARKGAGRVGLGALLPAVTRYGQLFTKTEIATRPAVSTGHGYTGYVIVDYLRQLVASRQPRAKVVRVAIMGAAGSTGKATLRMLMHAWNLPTNIDLVLVDVEKKRLQLQALTNEARSSGAFSSVHATADPHALFDCGYVVVVTNAIGSTVKPEYVRPGTVVIDDSQPRNTTEDLVAHGCHVLDVLARVPGLDCHFDFGFKTRDRSVTFTCLAETVIAAAVGDEVDLAVGEVTESVVKRVIANAQKAETLGLIGPLPFFSFGRELTPDERDAILHPVPERIVPAAE